MSAEQDYLPFAPGGPSRSLHNEEKIPHYILIYPQDFLKLPKHKQTDKDCLKSMEDWIEQDLFAAWSSGFFDGRSVQFFEKAALIIPDVISYAPPQMLARHSNKLLRSKNEGIALRQQCIDYMQYCQGDPYKFFDLSKHVQTDRLCIFVIHDWKDEHFKRALQESIFDDRSMWFFRRAITINPLMFKYLPKSVVNALHIILHKCYWASHNEKNRRRAEESFKRRKE